MNRLIRFLFPAEIWTRRTSLLCLITLLTIVWFDIEWCLTTTFTGLSMAETWVNALLLALLFSFPVIIWHSGTGQVASVTLLALWLEANLLYSRTYFTLIPLGSYGLVGNLTDFTASITDSFRPADAVFLLLIAAAVKVARRRRLRLCFSEYCTGALYWLCYLLIVGSISLLLLEKRGGFTEAWRSLQNANYHSCRAVMYTPVGYLINDALEGNYDNPYPFGYLDAADKWIINHASYDRITDTVPPVKNIVLVLCESLESWVIGLEVEGKEITPRLNSLLADSSTFFAPKVVTQVGAGRSIDAQLLINAGLYPPQREVYSMTRFNNEYRTLNRALAEARGSRSYILTVDKELTWNQGLVGRAFGFDTIVARDCWMNDEKVGSRKKLGDRSFMRQAVEKMISGEIWPEGENAFMQIVTYSGHNPFVLPESLDSLRLQGDYPRVVADYMTMAHYTDGAIGTLIDYLRSRPDFDSTLVVITGDHEGLASYRADAAASCEFVDSLQHTPLIVLNSPAGGRFNLPVGQIDIYPTIMEMAGLGGYNWHGLGELAGEGHPGVALRGDRSLEGNTSEVDSLHLARIAAGPTASDYIIRFNALHGREARLREKEEQRKRYEEREYRVEFIGPDGFPRHIRR